MRKSIVHFIKKYIETPIFKAIEKLINTNPKPLRKLLQDNHAPFADKFIYYFFLLKRRRKLNKKFKMRLR
jgi:hypothetical protein